MSTGLYKSLLLTSLKSDVPREFTSVTCPYLWWFPGGMVGTLDGVLPPSGVSGARGCSIPPDGTLNRTAWLRLRIWGTETMSLSFFQECPNFHLVA